MDSATKEIPAYMGTREEARAKLLEAARLYRETMQPAFLTASEIKKKDAITHERRSRLANAALLWVWFEEEQPALPSGSLREALEPFSEFLSPAMDRLPDDFVITAGSNLARKQLTVGHLRKARAVLSSTGGDRG